MLLRLLGLLETRHHGASAVFLPRLPTHIGGPRSFMSHLIQHAREQGVGITHNRFAKARAAIIPISMDPHALRDWKTNNPGSPVIQRLDGVFYDPQKSDFDPVLNGALQQIYHELADVLLFQSDYSRKQCEHFLGTSHCAKRQTIILNGTDLHCFAPPTSILPLSGRAARFITAGNFRDPEMLGPILTAIDTLPMPVTLEIAGPVKREFWGMLQSRSYVSCLGVLTPPQLAERLRSADVFVYSFLNPNCPNAVIEATACGLPVVGFDGGAMRELCGFNEDLLAPVQSSHPLIHKRAEIEVAAPALAACMERCISGLERYRERALAARARYDIALTMKAYLKLID